MAEDGLTPRLREVLAQIAEGKSNKVISEVLGLSESTVKAHVKVLLKRLGVENRTAAALLGSRAELQRLRTENAALKGQLGEALRALTPGVVVAGPFERAACSESRS